MNNKKRNSKLLKWTLGIVGVLLSLGLVFYITSALQIKLPWVGASDKTKAQQYFINTYGVLNKEKEIKEVPSYYVGQSGFIFTKNENNPDPYFLNQAGEMTRVIPTGADKTLGWDNVYIKEGGINGYYLDQHGRLRLKNKLTKSEPTFYLNKQGYIFKHDENSSKYYLDDYGKMTKEGVDGKNSETGTSTGQSQSQGSKQGPDKSFISEYWANAGGGEQEPDKYFVEEFWANLGDSGQQGTSQSQEEEQGPDKFYVSEYWANKGDNDNDATVSSDEQQGTSQSQEEEQGPDKFYASEFWANAGGGEQEPDKFYVSEYWANFIPPTEPGFFFMEEYWANAAKSPQLYLEKVSGGIGMILGNVLKTFSGF